MMRRVLVRLLVVASVVAGGLAATSSPAHADFHLMVISEVSDGTALDATADFVELQMYASGQNFVDQKELVFYNSSGVEQSSVTINGNVPNGENQRTILIGTGVGADKVTSLTVPFQGAACFADGTNFVDCVAWGPFDNSTAQLPIGTPVPGAMPLDDSLQRRITPNCPTLLEAADDTNDSATDFQAAPQTPRNNSVTPNETPCPGGPGGGSFSLSNLKTRVKGERAIISGKVQPPAPGQQVKLTFFANGSPLRKVSTKSATLNAASEFKKRFKVPADSTRCKVVVRFQGAKLGQKKFRC